MQSEPRQVCFVFIRFILSWFCHGFVMVWGYFPLGNDYGCCGEVLNKISKGVPSTPM